MIWQRNAWYVAAWDGEVGTAPLARTLLNVPVMLYRKLDGTPIAMRDACPHRMLPLSMGIKQGDSIRCRYHGLKLGPDGCAEEMPIRTDPVNRAICAESENRMHYFWGMARDFHIDDAGFTARFKAQQGGVFAQDVAVQEAQQRSMEANPDLSLRAYNVDSGGVRARRMTTKLIEAEGTAA